MKKIVIPGVLLLAVAGGAAYFLLGGINIPQVVEGDASSADGPGLPIFYTLDPEFVIAFQGPANTRLVKVSIEVMVRDGDVIEDLKQHMPAIRDAVIILFDTRTRDDLVTPAGRENLRQEILQTIRDTLERLTGRPGVEAVDFPGFAIQ